MKLKKGKKYYFYDNGIRNVLISNYANLGNEEWQGCIMGKFFDFEQKKTSIIRNSLSIPTFGAHDRAEIDYIEEKTAY